MKIGTMLMKGPFGNTQEKSLKCPYVDPASPQLRSSGMLAKIWLDKGEFTHWSMHNAGFKHRERTRHHLNVQQCRNDYRNVRVHRYTLQALKMTVLKPVE